MGHQPESAQVGRSKPRLPGLDLLRLLAIVLVLGRHMPYPPTSWPWIFQQPLLTWKCGGWVGVDLFFVLSGFLVSGLLFTEYRLHGSLGVGRFYMRRGWKIYPPYFFLLAVTIVFYLVARRPIPRMSLISELFFLRSYFPGLWFHTWSLAVEEHFYILLPLVLILILRLNRTSSTPLRPLLSLTVAVAVACFVLRLVNWQLRPRYNHLTHLFPTHLRLDSLLFGVAISYGYHFHWNTFVRLLTPWRGVLIFCGAASLSPAFLFKLETTPFIYTAGLTLFYLGSGMMLVGILLCRIPVSRPVVWLATLGAYSYSIYLWHMPLREYGLPWIEQIWGVRLNYGIWIAIFFIGSFVLGIFMAKIVELPMLRLRDRWFPSRSPGAIEDTGAEKNGEEMIPVTDVLAGVKA
jgi:peptidoglycan/LPS O-acetylase OafA/YrhL